MGRETLRENSIFFHRSYVGAALQLHLSDSELVPKEALHKIASDAVEEFDTMREYCANWKDNWDEAEQSLRMDLREVKAYLEELYEQQNQRMVPLPELTTTRDILQQSSLTRRSIFKPTILECDIPAVSTSFASDDGDNPAKAHRLRTQFTKEDVIEMQCMSDFDVVANRTPSLDEIAE